ncbi:hypothetical protein, partial [uncultured Desulfovibrio sp.]
SVSEILPINATSFWEDYPLRGLWGKNISLLCFFRKAYKEALIHPIKDERSYADAGQIHESGSAFL